MRGEERQNGREGCRTRKGASGVGSYGGGITSPQLLLCCCPATMQLNNIRLIFERDTKISRARQNDDCAY